MSAQHSNRRLSRYTDIYELSQKVRNVVKRMMLPLTTLLAVSCGYLFLIGRPGAISFILMCIGTSVALSTWSSGGIGLLSCR